MNGDLTENIWARFVIETDEHFDLVDRILLAANGADIGSDSLERLFRSFQSIQWLSSSMDAVAMEMLSGYVRELLEDVCDGVLEPGASLASQLQEAVDDLKTLRANVLVEQGEAISLMWPASQAFHDDPHRLSQERLIAADALEVIRGGMPKNGDATTQLKRDRITGKLPKVQEMIGTVAGGDRANACCS